MNPAIQILITDTLHPHFIEEMQVLGCKVDYKPELNREEVLSILSRYQILLINSKINANKELIDIGKNLIAIGRIGSGLEVIDLEYARSKKIICFNAPEGNKDAVAEHALGILLSLLNHIHIAHQEVKNKLWLREKNRGDELGGKTVGIIGFGNNGSAFAQKLKGFSVRILAYDKYKTNYGNAEVEESTMETIFKEANIVSLHLPLTTETHQIFNQKMIAQFLNPFYFLNISRGKCVNYQDLIHGLEEKKIIAAGLDVLENENFEKFNLKEIKDFEKLISFDNVIITPHIAGWTHQSKFKIAQILSLKLKEILSIY